MTQNRIPTAASLILAIGFLVLLFNSGSRFAIGLLLKPMADDLTWTRSTLALAVTVFMTVTACALPFVGRLVDRFGPQRILAGGIALSGVSLGLMMLVRSPAQAVIVYGLLFGVGSAATSITPIGVMITRWFPERAGLANSVAISGMGVGQLAVITVLASQLDDLGWRGAFLSLAAINLLLLLPLVVLVVGPRLTAPPAASPPPAVEPTSSGPGQGIYRSPRLWLLLAVYGVCGFQDFFVATHVVAFALDQEVPALVAGNMLAAMGLFGLVGVLAAGAWSDRAGPLAPTLACFVFRLGLFALILVDRSLASILVFALAYGLTFWVTAPLTVVFAKQTFAIARLGAVTGLITMAHHFAGGLGAYFGAVVFDTSGSYDTVFQLMLGLSLLAAILTRLIQPAVATTLSRR